MTYLSESACNFSTVVHLDHSISEYVSPRLFGTNIEHTRSCIYRGLSAQMLRNRKFAGFPEACSGHASQWYAIGEKAFYVFDVPYTRHHERYHMKRQHECQSQQIVNPYEGELCGIGQHELFICANKHYCFRMAAKTTQPADICIALTSRYGGEVYASQTFKVLETDWKVYEAELISSADDPDADIRITFSNQAAVSFGFFSLLPADSFHGMRKDVIAQLQQMGIRMLRWPGGNFAGEYNWLDGLLPVDMRAPLQSYLGIETQPHTTGYDFHEVGIDEFIALCREVGAEPFITINPCWNTPEENADWVEYCNGDSSTTYGRIRMERGYPEPYNVRMWSLGNEFGYGHMEGENTPEGYCRIAAQNAQKMLEVCPELELCTSGPYPSEEWTQKSAIPLKEMATLVSHHFYACFKEGVGYSSAVDFKNEFEAGVKDVFALRDMLRRSRSVLPREIGISMDEWNVWHAWYRSSSVKDGIFTALTLHMLMGEAQECGIAQSCHFEAINEGLLCVKPNEAYLTAQGQVFSIMKHHRNGRICHKSAEVCATFRDGVVTVTVVNSSYEQNKAVQIKCGGEALQSLLYTSESVISPSVFEQHVLALEQTDEGFTCCIPAHSIAFVQLRTEK